MRAHIIGGGFGGLAAAALLIRNAGASGADITIYEADEQLGGGFFLGGSAESGYNLPGSVFDKEFRCTFELLKSIPSTSNPSISVTEEFFAFNAGEPYLDRAHIFDRDGRVVHGARFGLSLRDGLRLARVGAFDGEGYFLRNLDVLPDQSEIRRPQYDLKSVFNALNVFVRQ
jgi:oleate hydratase